MKKVLILIDNQQQYDRIKKIIQIKKNNNFIFEFYHSPILSAIWEHEDFRGKNKIIDVKEKEDFLIENYYLIISVHCFQFFPKKLVDSVRCINIHPGYNPINRGWYPQVFAIIYNFPIGATIHEMDKKLDNGGIIAREFVEKYIWDNSLSLYNRVLDKEIELFEKNFDSILHNSYQTIEPEGNGNLFSKSDFNQLLELDLTRRGSFAEFYNLLRALTHGDYKNAFFIDKESGKKVFLKLDISHE